MNLGSSFVWKIGYAVGIAVLLFPLFLLGQPASVDAEGNRSPGGTLARLRHENQLSQANLGDIDPASESMRLATVGMRGVAANLLWTQANHYKKVHDFNKLSATLNQMAKIQPNYISVWEFQAHNLSYNVSVEFDNYRHRYHWVKKGIEFLIRGTQYNTSEPKLLSTVGWYTGQKIGRSDEKRQFRDMFRIDDEFHATLNNHIKIRENRKIRGPDGKPDNWLVSRLWYLRAESLVDDQGVTLRGTSPLVFHKHAPMTQMNFSSTIEEEGYFGSFTRDAWRQASDLWDEFGKREIPTSWGMRIRLGDSEETARQIQELREELDSLAPGERTRLMKERDDLLTARERLALTTPIDLWKTDLMDALQSGQRKTQITDQEIAELTPKDLQRKAKRLARELMEKSLYAARVAQYQNTIAYRYWLKRADLEQTEKMTTARRLVYEAKKALNEARLSEAKKLYDESWDIWAELFDEHQVLRDDLAAEDLSTHLKSYVALLRQMDEEFPSDFKLRFLLEDSPAGQAMPLPTPGRITPSSKDKDAAEPAVTPDEKPADKKADTEKPADAKPADEKPADKKADTEKPADAKPADEKPADKKADSEKPADAKPADEKPADKKADTEKPADEKPADEKPADKKADTEKPADAKPADEKPADKKADTEKPADAKPADEKPADKKADTEKPADEKPADEKPADKKADSDKPAAP